MNTIFKYAMIMVGVYFGINWIADNPQKVDSARHSFNQAVDGGTQAASDAVTEIMQQ